MKKTMIGDFSFTSHYSPNKRGEGARAVPFHAISWDKRGYRESCLLTPQFRETFYYARERKPKDDKKRKGEPIRYNQ